MKTILTTVIVTILLSACATAPQPDELAGLTKVRFGEKLPENQDYIVYFEAGQEVPLNLLVDGDLIDKTVDYDTTVTLKKPIYAYKQWGQL